MDFIHLFHREEKIAAVAINSDGALVLSLEKRAAKKGMRVIEAHGSIPVPAGTIEEGGLVNVRVMGERLRELWNTSRPMPIGTPFVVASLPSSLFHFQSFRFPGGLSHAQIENAMHTQVGFALPSSTDLMYFDWEEAPPRVEGHREIFFVWARRSAIDPYLAAFRDASFIPIAIEPHYVSIVRTLDIPTEEHVRVIAILQPQEMTTIIYERGCIRFVRVTPWARHALSRSATTPEEAQSPSAERIVAIVSDEIRRTLLFYQSEMNSNDHTAIFTLIPLLPLPSIVNAVASELAMQHAAPLLCHSLKTVDGIKEEDRMHPIFGAAERTVMSRKLDTIVSIMPVGTEVLYQRTKALAFTRFMHDFLSAFALYFALLFGMMAFGFSLFVNQQQIHAASRNNFTLPQQIGQWERDAAALNTSVVVLEKIHAEQPAWPNLFRMVARLFTPGVTITSFIADRSASVVTIMGEAENLQALLNFKKSLESSTYFERIDLSLNVFSQAGHVPFSLPLTVKEYKKILFSPQ